MSRYFDSQSLPFWPLLFSILIFLLGVLIPGGFGTRGVEGKIAAAQWARTNEKPLLGICLGLQCAVIEFARNVLNKQNAHTTEIGKSFFILLKVSSNQKRLVDLRVIHGPDKWQD